MELRFGEDFSSVRLHTDSVAAASARSVQAKAYTVGDEIVLGASSPPVHSEAGAHILAHELTHVVQQRSGPVDGTSVGGGIKVSDPSDRFERQAEQVADAVMSPNAAHQTAALGSSASGGGSLQREEEIGQAEAMPLQREAAEEEEEPEELEG